MTRPSVSLALLAAWLCMGAGATTLSEEQWARAASAPPVNAYVALFERAVAADDSHGLAQHVRDALSDPGLTDPQREAVLYRAALYLGQVSDVATGPLLARLAERPTTIRVQRRHDGHLIALPAFDTAAAARFAQTRRQIDAATTRAAQALAAHTELKGTELIRAAKADASTAHGTHIATAGAARAVSRASIEQLAAQRAFLGAQLAHAPELGEAARIAAKRLGDDALLAMVLAHAPQRVALEAVHTAAAWPDPAQRVALLGAAIERRDTASAGLLALAGSAHTDAVASQRLFDVLQDPVLGASAAAAIARADRREDATRLADDLDAAQDPLLAARLALALSLMRNDVAVARLQQFVDGDRGPAALKTKLRRARASESR